MVSIAVGLVLAAGVILLIGRASGFAKLADRLEEADPAWILAAVAVQCVSITGYVIAFRATIGREGARVGPWTATHIVLASLGATRLLAAAGAGGLAVNYWALRRLTIDPRESVIRVLALNTLLYGIFGLVGFVAAVALLASGTAPPALAITWIVVVPACLVAARFVSQPGRLERLAWEPGPDATGPRFRLMLRRGSATIIAAVGRVRAAVAEPRGHAALLAGCGLYWAGDIACLGFGLRAFDIDVSLGVVVLGYVTGYAANVLPLPTGGVGGVDAAMTFALAALGVPLQDALAGVIAYRFVGFWLPTIPAAWALVTLPRLGRSLEEGATPV